MDVKRVNAAVKIKITIQKMDTMSPKSRSLRLDLNRLITSMTSEEYTEYQKRVA